MHKRSYPSSLLLRTWLAVLAFSVLPISQAQDFIWAPDFPVGTALPPIAAQDQDGSVRNFDDLKGEKGLLFMFSRSFDW